MRKILLTRSGEDANFADELGRLLTKLRFEVWIDISGIRWEFKTMPRIQAVFDQCDIMIVIVSPASMQSPQVSNNWQYFLDQRKLIIPVIWQPAEIPEPLQREQYIDFSEGDYITAFALLRVALKPSNDETEDGSLYLIGANSAAPSADTTVPRSNRMERFTQRARRVVFLATEAATQLGHAEVGSEHMLLGMLREEGGVAGRVLRDLGVKAEQVEALLKTMKSSPHETVQDEPILTASAKRVLELAVDETRRMGHFYLGTEHLLLAVTRLSDDAALDILKRLGVHPEEARRSVRRVLMQSPIQNPPPKLPDDSNDPPVSPI